MGLGLALVATLAGGARVVQDARLQRPASAELGGLRLRVDRAVWLHESTDHGDAAALPSLDGVPRPGARRLAVALTVFNPRGQALRFSPGELRLTGDAAEEVWRPSPEDAPAVSLRPAQVLPVTVSFDVPPTSTPLRLEWTRGPERQLLQETRRPRSADTVRQGWPRRVEELPAGNASAGAALFHGRLACRVCHGDPEAPGSARIAPALHAFARVGATRVPGTTAAQYAYESLLDPNAFIVPECTTQVPCPHPSTMPLYGEVLSPREMADLIRYLVNFRSEE